MTASAMTKVQVLDENARLRAECARLEALLAAAHTHFVDMRTAEREAVEALHALRDEMLAANLARESAPVAPIQTRSAFWIDRNGNVFQRVVEKHGHRTITRNVRVPA